MVVELNKVTVSECTLEGSKELIPITFTVFETVGDNPISLLSLSVNSLLIFKLARPRDVEAIEMGGEPLWGPVEEMLVP